MNHLYISEDYFEKYFTADTGKEALLQCTKWLAQNMINQKVEAGEIHLSIVKDTKASLPTFKLTLYSAIKVNEFQDKFCDRCKEFTKSFYMTYSDARCSTCNMRSYFDQLKEKFKIINGYRKKLLP